MSAQISTVEPTEQGDDLLTVLNQLSLVLELGKVIHYYQAAELGAAFARLVRS